MSEAYTHVRVKEDALRGLKVYSAKTGRPMCDIVTELVENFLNKKKGKKNDTA